MKRSHFCIFLVFFGTMVGCKKADDPNKGFPEEITRIVPQEVINTMRQHGMTVNEGKQPPSIEGIYLFSENILSGSSLPDDEIGEVYADYRFRFYEQDNSNFSIKTSFKGYRTDGSVLDEAVGLGSLISGNGSAFSVFAEEKGQSSKGATYTHLRIYSGEHTPSGIRNFQRAFYLKEKNDPNNEMVDVGTVRVFEDSDDLSETQNSLRISAEAVFRNPKAIRPAKSEVTR